MRAGRVVVGLLCARFAMSPVAACAELLPEFEHGELVAGLEQGALLPDVVLERPAAEAFEAARHIRDWRVVWDRGLYLESSDRYWVLRLGGRLQTDVGAVVPNDEIDGRFGFDGVATRAQIRRARLYVRGTIGRRVDWKIQYDFANQIFNDLYVAIRDVGPIDLVHVGNFKEPFSLEELVSSNDTVFLERGLPNALVSGRKGGVAALSAFLGNRLTFELGLFGDTSAVRQLGDTFSQTGSGFDLTLRATGLPLRLGPHHFLHVGGSFLRRVRSDDTTRFRSPPESALAPFLVDTGDFQSDGGNSFGLEVAYVRGRLYAQSEWIATSSNVVDDDAHHFGGFYVQAAWFLTDDQRHFLGKRGIWGRVTPRCDAFRPGCWGAWEVAARLSRLDLESGEIRGGILDDATLGLNWYLTDTLRVSANWIRGHLQSVGTAHVVQARFQVAY